MFIHIGNNQVIHVNDIIIIMDYQVLDSSPMMEAMPKKAENPGEIKEKMTDAKSIIITDDAVYYSSLSVTTLKKRSKKQPLYHENSDLPITDEL